MKKMLKDGMRRSFAVALSVLMLLSAWVFVAPEKAQAGGGSYTIDIDGVSTNDGSCDGLEIRVYYKDDNGQGSSNDYVLYSRNDDFNFDGTGNDDQSDTVSGFPYKVEYKVHKPGGLYSLGTLECHFDVKINNSPMGSSNYVSTSSSGWHTMTWEASSNQYPYVTFNKITGGSATLSVPKDTQTASTNAFAYQTGELNDNYGVKWYQTLSASWTNTSGSNTGISYNTTSKIFSITNKANRKNDYSITLTQYLGSSSVSSATIDVSTWDYTVEFYDSDQTSKLVTRTPIDYNGSADPPTTQNNVLTHGAGIAAKDADADYHYAFNGWTGDSYTNLTTGPQVKKVYAKAYTPSAHTMSGWKYTMNGDDPVESTSAHHWKECTVCGYVKEKQTHGTSNWVTTDPDYHWKTCPTCGIISVPKAGHNWKTTYENTDENECWIICKDCKRQKDRAGHTWDFSNIQWNWSEYECETAKLTCTRCNRTKIVDVTVSSVNTPATCEQDGSNVYTATFSLGGNSYSDTRTEVLERLGHKFNGAIHPLNNGRHNWLCANGCGNYGAMVNGVWAKNASVPCTEQEDFSKDASSHWKICTECSAVVPGTEESHTPKEDIVGRPIYDNDGDGDNDHHWIECSECGWHTTTDDLHTWQWVTDENENCTTDGSEHEVCTVCGLERSLNHVRPQWGHDWGATTYVWSADNSTVTATRSCTRGDKTETETVNTTFDDDVATCTATGTRHFTSNAFTNAAFAVQTKDVDLPIDPNNHLFNEQTKSELTLKSAATCEDDAVYYMSCSRCHAISDTVTFTDEGSALGHNFNGEAVSAGNGIHFYKCERFAQCEAYGVGETRNATEECSGGEATCQDKPICETCHTIYGAKDPDNHDFSDQRKTSDYLKSPATCEADAVYYYKCSRCSASSNSKPTYDQSTWTDAGSAMGHSFNGDFLALSGNKHSRKCENSWFIGTEEVFCDAHGLEVDGVMQEDAFVACTPGSVQKDASEHWVKCAYCDNLTTPRTAHTPKEHYSEDNSNHWIECSVCKYVLEEAQPHTYTDVIDVEPTCTEPGLKHNECTVCHKVKNENTSVPALGHNWGEPTYEWINVSGDTYQVTATHVCGRVSEHVETETVNATMATQRATCVAVGAKKYTSRNFTNPAFEKQEMTIELPIDPYFHNGRLAKVNVVKATCTEDGVKQHYECGLCHNKYLTNAQGAEPVSDEDLKIEARGHDWNAGTVTTPATCSEPGVMTFKCRHITSNDEYAICSATYTEEIPVDATNHDGHLTYVELRKATCTEDGELAHWYCDACNKKFSDEAGTVAATDAELKIDARPGGHVWNDGEVTTPQTCSADGVMTFTCTCAETEIYAACTATRTESIPADPSMHVADPTPDDYVPATCTDDGFTGEQVCQYCGTPLGPGEVIPALGHDYSVEDTEVPGAFIAVADCVSAARYYKSCSRCGTVEGNTEDIFEVGEIDPAHHRDPLTAVEAQAATCLAAGNKAHFHCAYCEKNYTDADGAEQIEEIVIAKLPHSYTGEAVNQGDGNHRLRCVNGCGELGEPVAHVWNDGTTVEPTCDEPGYTDYACTVPGCTGTKHDVIRKLGHSYSLPTYQWNADYTACTGTTVCANDIKGDGVIDHTVTETTNNITVQSTNATCKEPGKIVYTATFLNSVFGEKVEVVHLERGEHRLQHFDAIPATCTEDGYSEYWVCSACRTIFGDAAGTVEIKLADTFVPRRGHDYSGAVRNNNDGTHEYACVFNCGMYGNKTAHVFDQTVATEQYLASYSNCTEAARYYYSCICGAKGTVTFEGDPLGHDFKDVPGKAATCTEAGYTAHKLCAREGCGATTGKAEIRPLGHGQFLFDHERSGKVYDGTFEWATYSCSRGCGEAYTLFTIYAKDTKGKVVTGAEVNVTGNGVDVIGVTDRNGACTFDNHFTDGEYSVTITYNTGDNVLKAYGNIRIVGNKGSGGIGALELNTQQPTNPQPTNPQPTDPQPTNPSGGNNSSGGCRYCGGTHTGPFGWLIQLIHNILAAFSGK